MTFKQNLIRARSHLVFLAGLVTAFGLVISLERWHPHAESQNGVQAASTIEHTNSISPAAPAVLSEQQRQWAQIAWQYFENNYQSSTGMVNSTDAYPSTTLWDTSSYLMALISAERLQLITAQKFDERVGLLLQSLSQLKLYDGKLPNKAYNTQSLQMVDYNNTPSELGIGWSAIDIGRVLVPFNILVWANPQHTPAVKKLLSAWSFDALVQKAEIYGATVENGQKVLVQEGRLGYEQYAAKSLGLLGIDVSSALDYRRYLGYVDVYGIKLPIDTRDPNKFKAHNYVVSEPYILDGLEYGWDQVSEEFAYRVYAAQQQRFEHTGQLTAVSEDNIDEAPYFVYNTIYTDGKTWQTITDQGADASKFRSISTKAAFGWNALYHTAYSEKLLQSLAGLNDPAKGWYSGLYETSAKPNKAITANTNAIILESLCYQQFGPLIRHSGTSQ